MKNSFEKHALEEPQGENPNIKIAFYFGIHEDIREYLHDFLERCKSADVIVLESAGWDAGSLKASQEYLDGKVPRERLNTGFVGSDFTRKTLSNLYNSNKVLLYVDIPEGSLYDKVKKLMSEHYTNLVQAEEKFSLGKFNEALQFAQASADMLYKAGLEREKAIVHNIHNKIGTHGKLVKDFPRLEEKTEISVLIFFGFGHSTVYHDYRRKYSDLPTANLSLIGTNIAVGSQLELYKRMRRGLPAGNESLSHVLFEGFIVWVLEEFMNAPMDKIDEVAAFLARRFGFVEIKEISESFALHPYSTSRARSVLGEALHRKGINFPTTEADVDRLLPKWKF